MSYQQTYRSMSTPANQVYRPSPRSSSQQHPGHPHSSHRNASPGRNHNAYNHHNQPVSPRSAKPPIPSMPLSLFPPRGPVSPSITPPPADTQRYCGSPVSSIMVSTPTTTTSTSSPLKHLTNKEIDDALQACLRIQDEAVNEHGKRPFAALLLGPDNVSIIATHNSISHFQHAESELARLAGIQYSSKYLERCTLVSTWEPCAMCAGTIYWIGIGRLLYAASETKLKELTGADNPENMTMDMPCRTVFAAGQRKIEVVGPLPTWEQRVVDEAGKWWKHHQQITEAGRRASSSVDNSSMHSKQTSVSVYNPDDTMLGSIGEDGEYQADLKVDWM